MLHWTRSLVARFTTVQVVLALSSGAHSVSAEPRGVTTLALTRSSSAQSCIDAAALTRSVEARLGRRAFARTAPLQLRVTLDRRGSNWVADLDLSDPVGPLGERSLSTDAAHCSALDDSLALVVALLVDTPPERVDPAAPGRADHAPEAPATTPRQEAPRPRSTTLRLPADTWAPRAPWQFAARAGGSLLFFALPRVAYGPSLGLAVRPPRGPWLRIAVDSLLPKESEGQRRVRVATDRLGLLLCGSFGSPPLEWQFCAGQRVGRVTAEGLGFDHAQRVRRLYLAATLGGELSIPLTQRWYFPVSLFAEIPLTQDQFVARDTAEPLHRVGAVVGAVSVALEFRGGS